MASASASASASVPGVGIGIRPPSFYADVSLDVLTRFDGFEVARGSLGACLVVTDPRTTVGASATSASASFASTPTRSFGYCTPHVQLFHAVAALVDDSATLVIIEVLPRARNDVYVLRMPASAKARELAIADAGDQ